MMTEGQGELHWYALRTLPQREDMAAKVLRRDGLVASIKTDRRLRRRTKWDKERKYITFNAAPGYVFIATPAGEDPRCFVRPLHIFRSFVGRDGLPMRLPTGTRVRKVRISQRERWDAEFEGETLPEFRTATDYGMLDFLNLEEGEQPGYFRHFKTGREFSIGDTVIINTGPFRDHQIKVEDIKDGEALFFLRLLGRTQEVRINVNDCIKAEAA